LRHKLLAFSQNTSALNISDAHELGFLWPGIYDGYGSEVWYVGNLSGIIAIPPLGGGGCGFTEWTLFWPR